MTYSILPACVRQGAVRPFVVNVPDEELARMKTLLSLSNIPGVCYENRLPGGNRSLGLPREWLIAAKREWENEFNWYILLPAHAINAFPHFKVSGAGLGATALHDSPTTCILFVALFSTNPSAAPILLLHGWSGSFLELALSHPCPLTSRVRLLGPLRADDDNGMEAVAAILDKLMSTILGFSDHTVQGGDIGSRIGRILAARHEVCVAALLNYSAVFQPAGMSLDDLTEAEKRGIARGNWLRTDGCTYALMQGTRPATVGLVLSTNPLALLAWIGEKYLDWIDPEAFPHDSVLEGSGTPYSRALMEQIMLSVSLYWLTGTAHASLYTYRECFAIGGPPPSSHESPQYRVSAPKKLSFSLFSLGGCAHAKAEHKTGGHFAALEQPASIPEDLE
ncbi:Alpha/Beta hydrolase protein [Immersiella caudata]|uniref:Alpha/Beta hydrolase protein n=1 Tax=Immersiella caudata TaxID=314043 RepID=A0AA39WY81_9PEZI|nr:Alpha/Beta hydrolase protein [Immersiella caudata]